MVHMTRAAMNYENPVYQALLAMSEENWMAAEQSDKNRCILLDLK